MSLDRKITIALLLLSFIVVIGGYTFLHFLPDETIDVDAVDTRWASIEKQVELDIGSVGYQFLIPADSNKVSIPAIDADEFDTCLRFYVDVRQVTEKYPREYLFKYNQIVRIRVLRAGIDCQRS